MDKASQVLFSMFEAFKVSVKLDIAKKAEVADLEKFKLNFPTFYGFESFEARLSSLENKVKELMWDDQHHEAKDEVLLSLPGELDDLEISLEKERRRKGLSESSLIGFAVSDSKGEELKTHESIGTLDELEDSFSQFRSLANTGTKASASDIGLSQKLMKRMQRQMLMLTKDYEQNKDRIDELGISLSSLQGSLTTVQGQLHSLPQYYQSFESQVKGVATESNYLRAKAQDIERLFASYQAFTTQVKLELSDSLARLHKDSSIHLTRIVAVETKVDTTSSEFKLFRGQAKDKINGCLEFVKQIANEFTTLKRNVIAAETEILKHESAFKRDVLKVRTELETMKEPVKEYIDCKARETETLAEEVKRNQELFRKLAVEYTAVVTSPMMNRTTGFESDEPKLVQLKNRPFTASPYRRIRANSAVNPSVRRTSNVNSGASTDKAESSIALKRKVVSPRQLRERKMASN